MSINHLRLHKIPHLMVSCSINTNTNGTVTQRIEQDVKELRSDVATLLRRLEVADQKSQEREVIIGNYDSTIRQRIAQGVDSITSAYEFPERPPSPSLMVSSLEITLSSDRSRQAHLTEASGPSYRSCSTYETAPSQRTIGPSIRSRSTYATAPSNRGVDATVDIDSRTVSVTEVKTVESYHRPSDKKVPGRSGQIFVKGLLSKTIRLQPDKMPLAGWEVKRLIHDKVDIQGSCIYLLLDGRFVNNDSILKQNNCTLFADVRADVRVDVRATTEFEIAQSLAKIGHAISPLYGRIKRGKIAKPSLYIKCSRSHRSSTRAR